MRNFLNLATALFICVVIGGSADAKDFCSGDVVKVNAEKRTLVISTESDCCGGRMIELEFTLGEKTKVTLDAKDSTLAKLKTGDRVDVEYEDLDDVTKVSAKRESSK